MANRRDYSVSITGTQTYKNPFGGVSNSPCQSRYASRVATDYPKRKLPLGRWRNPTSYGMTEQVHHCPTGQVNQGGFYGDTVISGTLDSSGPMGYASTHLSNMGVKTVFPADLASEALTNARIKVKSQEINLAQAFVERGQTAGFVANNLETMAKIARAFRRRNFKYLRRYLSKDISEWRRDFLNEWLEFQYAMKPLMSDIHGAVTQLDGKTARDQYVVTVKARKQRKIEIKFSYHQPGQDAYMGHYDLAGECLYSSFVRLDLIPSNQALITAASLGFTNPAYLAWETTRLSFVVDWAFPLGDYFSQMDALLGYEVKGFSQSNLIKIDVASKGLPYNTAGGYRVLNNWTAKSHFVQLQRDGGLSVPFAELPSVKDPFNSGTRVMNALALLTQALRL